ncbi:MAG: hypothetical protein COA59_03995 [Colwellia sp.]|nr:MAG: hypothetical protein COA59_03995 [Colwellia sp.]
MANKTLIFSIALNGYQWIYKKELDSHKNYANKNGYDYQAITRPYFSSLGVECCWLKLTLMRTALLAGYQHVVFIDADAMVKHNCPAIETLFIDNKYIYMAKGYSNRFNSGVLIVRNKTEVIDWLTRVIDSRILTVANKNSVGWGENGHIIELSQNCPFIQEIDQRWNNTYDNNMADFIHHKNCGPLRTNLIDNFLHKLIFCLSYRILTLTKSFKLLNKKNIFDNKLDNETDKIITIYPHFTSNKYD